MNGKKSRQGRRPTAAPEPLRPGRCTFCMTSGLICEQDDEEIILCLLDRHSGHVYGTMGCFRCCLECARLFDQGEAAALVARSEAAVRAHWPENEPLQSPALIRAAVLATIGAYAEIRVPAAARDVSWEE